MRASLILIALALGTASPQAHETAPDAQSSTERTSEEAKQIPTAADFAKQAAQANLYEIQAAEIALQRAKQPGVRDLAQGILADHKKAQEDLIEAAQGGNEVIDDKLEAAQSKQLQALREAGDGEFDALYLSDQLRSHQAAMEFLSAYAENGEAGPLKTYAQAAFPTVRMHLVKVKAHSNSD